MAGLVSAGEVACYVLSGLLGAATCTAIVACIVAEVRARRRKRERRAAWARILDRDREP
jgi:hypothetical protein